jgi:hypothetical protein
MKIAVSGARAVSGGLVASGGDRFAGPIGRTGSIPDGDVVIDVSTPDGLAVSCRG